MSLPQIVAVEEVMRVRASQFVVLREVALSALIQRSGVSDSDALKSIYRSGSLDIVVHGLPPHNQPLLAIEYDGKDHEKGRQKANDGHKNDLLSKVGLPLLRIVAKQARASKGGAQKEVISLMWIAGAVVDRQLKALDREQELGTAAERDHKTTDVKNLADGVYGRHRKSLDADQLKFLLQTVDFSLESVFDDPAVDHAIDEHYDALYRSLEHQLEIAGVDGDLISDFAITHERESGCFFARGTFRPYADQESRKIETIRIYLHAPKMEPAEVSRLVEDELNIQFATEAAAWLRLCSNNAPRA